jgi:hypothetical protein
MGSPQRPCRTISRKGSQSLEHKKELADITLAPGEFRKEWGRLLKTITKEEFACKGLREVAGAVQKVHSNQRELCLDIIKNKFPSNVHGLVFITYSSTVWNSLCMMVKKWLAAPPQVVFCSPSTVVYCSLSTVVFCSPSTVVFCSPSTGGLQQPLHIGLLRAFYEFDQKSPKSAN